MAQSPAGKPRKTPKPAASPKKAAGSSASKPKAKPAPKAKPPAKPAPVPRKKPAPPPPPAPKKRAPAKKAAAKSPSPALADTAIEHPGDDEHLSPRIQRFVDEYLIDLNGTQAAKRAGYSAHTAPEQASRLLTNVKVQAAIAVARKAQQERTQITADKVLLEIARVAFADPRELSEVYKGCCRHCWGEGFKRQHTVGEQNARMEAHAKKCGTPGDFDEEGGIGYNPHKVPHQDCPQCMGQGHARTVIKDTRYLSPAALALYAGAEDTKYGVKVHTHSKMAAVEMLNKHLGLYEKDNKQKVDPLAELLHSIASSVGNGFKPVANDPEHDGR